jgi:outer membrane lipopolysaccharide assembly protein LptE/RlpB
MMKLWLLLALLPTVSCGYKMVGWSSGRYKTMTIRPVSAAPSAQSLALRTRDALIERCLAGSGLTPVESDGDLRLDTRLIEYQERVIATGIDGRTERVQFTFRADFSLTDREGRVLWQLDNYQYSDQYGIATVQEEYRDEKIFEQDSALRTIADLVITNISLAISAEEAENDE